MSNSDKPRPPKRDKPITFRVPQEWYDKAEERAQQEGRSIGSILRSFFFFWSNYDKETPPRLPDDNVRAQKTSRKKKR